MFQWLGIGIIAITKLRRVKIMRIYFGGMAKARRGSKW
jgi:hypothetical protein